MRLTINDIAKLAGVSRTTVSRALNNKSDINSETLKKIQTVIEQQDFWPSFLAKAAKLNRSSTVGVVIPYSTDYILSNLYYSEILRGISSEAKNRGYYLLLIYSLPNADYITVYKEKRVDGFIIVSPNKNDREVFAKLDEQKVPYTATAKTPEPGSHKYVDVDNEKGILMGVTHLASLGHEKMAFINVSSFLMSYEDRLSGFKKALALRGINGRQDYIVDGESSIRGGFEAAEKLIKLENKPTAFVCGNDMMAMGVIKLLKSKGFSVPGDFSVIGYDDIPLAQELDPPLTTIRQPTFDKGVHACSMLIDEIEDHVHGNEVILPVELVIRGTTAVPDYTSMP